MTVSEYAALIIEYGEDQSFAIVCHEHGFECAELVHRRWYRYLLSCDH